MKSPLRIGIIGMGGFAGSHHSTVAQLEERGVVRLICTCDPKAPQFSAARLAWKLSQRGVSVFEHYQPMLDACQKELDLVVVPTPINLHAEMHDAITARGIPAYLEKPPTLDHAELGRMIAADRRARKASMVGFNFIIEPARLALKQRIIAGEFGAIRGATLSALWPRPESYFFRNEWASRLMIGQRLVLDSCLGNAMAHFVHNMLFWTGTPDLFSWSEMAAVRAELYRAHAIEGADTFFVEADNAAGVTLRFALSHACAGLSSHRETVLCENAVLTYIVGSHAEVRWNDGRAVERISLEPFDALAENHLDFYRYLRGESPRPATTLTDSEPFVVVNDLAYISSGRIHSVPPARLSGVREEKEQKDYLSIAGLGTTVDQFLTQGVWPSAEWGCPGGEVMTPGDLPRLADVIRSMQSK